MTYSGSIVATSIYFFGVEKFVANFIFFDLEFSVISGDLMVD
jgi:hypothetical protein